MLLFGSYSIAQESSVRAAGQPAAKVAQPGEKKKLYDEAADAKVQIAEAVAKAKKNNRRVLIQWGGNWCSWCIKLNELCISDPGLKKKLQYEYDVVHVDAGKDDKNMDLIKSYGAEAATKGFPYLTILDRDGKVVANQDSEAFEKRAQDVSAGHDAKALLEFLTKNQAPAQDAGKLVEAGIANAKQEGKLVFLHFGAPWCGYCHKLEAWMARPEIAAILAKQFVDVKVDTDRDTGGGDALVKYAGSDKVGIPWFAFLNGEGKDVANSFKDKSNVGFPMEASEVAHFESMLKAATKLSGVEVKALVESLRAKEDRPAH